MPRVCNPLSGELAAYQGRWIEFGQLLDDIEAALMRLPRGTSWPIVGTSGSEVGIVTLADFHHKFDNFSWSLTTEDYSAVNGGVGAVVSHIDDRVWQGAAEEINAANFVNYVDRPERTGATYLALHEVAHTTDLGLRLNTVLYDEFIHGGGAKDQYPNSSQWWYNERTANRIALQVANAIRFPILNNPTGGYNLDVMIRQMEFA
jgi:hypothetical protein